MKKLLIVFALLLAALGASHVRAQESFATAKDDFEKTCAVCHGSGGGGGDRAPALADNPDLRRLDAEGIAAIIRRGMPGGMPAFANLPQPQVTEISAWLKSMNESALRKRRRSRWRLAKSSSSARAVALAVIWSGAAAPAWGPICPALARARPSRRSTPGWTVPPARWASRLWRCAPSGPSARTFSGRSPMWR